MRQAYNCQTADSGWLTLANEFLTGNDFLDHDGRGGPTKELLHVGLSIADPRQRWVLSRKPAMNPAFAIAEVIWILSGRNDANFLNYFNRSLPNYAGNTDTYPGAYGNRLRKHFGLDQLERAYHVLSNNKETRQVVLQIWDAETDLPHFDGNAASADIPCNVLSMLKIRNNRLEWTQVMRSNDFYRGLPHNIVQFTTIQEVIAGWIGVKLGSYNHFADSLHTYDSDLECVAQSDPMEETANVDNLALSKVDSDAAIKELARCTELIISENSSEQELIELVKTSNLPCGYKNMLCLLCAESGRRRHMESLISRSLTECSNPLFIILFKQWFLRFDKKA